MEPPNTIIAAGGSKKTTKAWWKKLLEEGEALVPKLTLGMEHIPTNTTSGRAGSHVKMLLAVSTRFIIIITLTNRILSSWDGSHH